METLLEEVKSEILFAKEKVCELIGEHVYPLIEMSSNKEIKITDELSLIYVDDYLTLKGKKDSRNILDLDLQTLQMIAECVNNLHIKFAWKCESDDDCFKDESSRNFDSEEECYYNMRDAALEKMRWNTEYDDLSDMEDNEYIDYNVYFYKHKIIHKSYSGTYTYQIIKVVE